jgi:cytochrome P450
MSGEHGDPRPYPFGANARLDLHPLYRQVREHEPLSWVRLPYGEAAWLVTRYDDVKTVLGDSRFSRTEASRHDQPRLTPEVIPFGLLDMDPPEHTRMRRLIAKAFTTGSVENLRPRAEQIAAELIKAMIAAGSPADFVKTFARRLPMIVSCELLGVPNDDQGEFADWVNVATSLEASRDQRAEALARQATYIAELVAQRRQRPTDDLLGRLVLARDDDDRLSEAELNFLSMQLLAAGFETTTNQLADFVYLLLTSPGEYALLCARPELIPGAVEELLRFIPLVASAAIVRYATEDVELSGGTVRAGEAVLTFAPAANRDPAVYADPDVLDLTRPAAAHLSFGHGVHLCVGARLARMELQVGLYALTRDLPGLRLAADPDAVAWKPSVLVRGPSALPVTWDLAAGRDKSGFVGEHDCLGAVSQAELGQDALDVALGRLGGDGECVADLRIGHTLGDQLEYFRFPAGQDVQRGGRGGDGQRLAGEVGDQPPGDRRGEQRVARGDDLDRVDEFGGGGVLEQESAGACPQRLVHVFVEVEGGQHQYPRDNRAASGGAGKDLPRGGKPVHHRHAHVHQHHVGFQPTRLAHRVGAVDGLPGDDDAGFGGEHGGEPLPHHGLIVGDQAADGPAHAIDPLSGRTANTTNPPSGAGPADSEPPSSSARSRIPARPCPFRSPSAPCPAR